MSVLTENYRYIRYKAGEEEFYHNAIDPHEWTNQINNPEFGVELKRHIAMLPTHVETLKFKDSKIPANKPAKDGSGKKAKNPDLAE